MRVDPNRLHHSTPPAAGPGRWPGRVVNRAAWLLMLVLANGACLQHRPSPTEQLERARREYAQGQILAAYRRLQQLGDAGRGLGPQFEQLRQQLQQATGHLVKKWIERGDFWLAQGNLDRALKYYADVAESLPPNDPLRERLLGKARLLQERVGLLNKQIAANAERARRLLAHDQVDRAKELLLQARQLALENGLAFPITHERLLEECLRRDPDPFTFEWAVEPPSQKRADEGAPRSRRLSGSHQRSPAPAPRSTAAGGARSQRLLEQARQALADKRYLKAIVALQKVLREEPGNQQARSMLGSVEPIRQQLVRDLMEKANTYFARQQLERAAPYYRQVLAIDPDNIRAREGMQMYRRLKVLQKKQRR